MKKLLFAIILGFLAVSLLSPVASNTALAQIGGQQLNECCKISSHFNASGGIEFDHKNRCIIGETSGSCSYLSGTEKLNATYDNITDKKCGTTGGTTVDIFAINDWGIICLLNTVYTTTNWIFYLMMIAVVLVFVIAGAMFMMAGGDTTKTKKGKGLMTLAIVGLVIALLAKLVPSVVKMIVGM